MLFYDRVEPSTGTLKVDLQNDFTTGDNQYPKNHQQTLHLLDKYSKTVVPKVSPSKGTSFVQRGGRGSGNQNGSGAGRGNGSTGNAKPFNKDYWKDKECFKCHEKGHPASHCPKADNNDDEKSHASAKSIKKLMKEIKTMKKAFTQLKVTEETSSVSECSTDKEDLHFQIGLQFAQIECEFEPRIARLFKQAHQTK
jgi:hypothetical protein